MSFVEPEFWCGRRVLITGHTGFKGSWCALWLSKMGASVTGLALAPETTPSLFANIESHGAVVSEIGDIRDARFVRSVAERANAEIVLHFAAQALVRRSIRNPAETYETNILGTVNLLDVLRSLPATKAILIITSDKVYENLEQRAPFVESDPLGGNDPYSASKAAADIVARSMGRTFFANSGVGVATARGGNVIGGGDYAEDRLIPDIVRAIDCGKPLVLRYPNAVRPWQHVLDCVAAYLVYVQALVKDPARVPESLNVGPEPGSNLTVRDVTEFTLAALSSKIGWRVDDTPKLKESIFLSLDTSKIRKTLSWCDRLPGRAGLNATADWYRMVQEGRPMFDATMAQISDYMLSGCALPTRQ